MSVLNKIKGYVGGQKQPKKLTKKQQQKRDEDKAFVDEYKAVCDRHKRKLDIIYQFTKENGTEALLAVVDHQPIQVQNWSKSMRDNLETRKQCKHKADGSKCSKCGLEKNVWGPDNTGVTQDYEERQERLIALEIKKELK